MKKDRINISVKDLHLNEGQLQWLGANPREGTQEDINKTCASLEEDKDFLDDRPLLVVKYADKDGMFIEGHDGEFIVFCGNLRLTAARQLGWKQLPCVVYMPEDDNERKTVIRRMFKDNGTFGSWDAPAVDAFNIPKEVLAGWGVEDLDWPVEVAAAPSDKADLSDKLDFSFKLEISCANETEQEELYNEFKERGYECRLLTL